MGSADTAELGRLYKRKTRIRKTQIGKLELFLVRWALFFGPEKCLKEFKSRVGVDPKRRFWSTVFSLRKWTKINFLDQNQLFRTKIAF